MEINFLEQIETNRLVEMDLEDDEKAKLLEYGRKAILKDEHAILQYAVIDILKKTIDEKNLKTLEDFDLIKSFEKTNENKS